MSETQLVWRCDGCGEPVADGAGYINVDYCVAIQAQNERENRERRRDAGSSVRVSDLRVHGRVPWQVHHRKCDLSPSRYDYWYRIEEVRTLEQLFERTLHLSGKRWLRATDWIDFCRGALARNRVAAVAIKGD
jgi:hypothetical protein